MRKHLTILTVTTILMLFLGPLAFAQGASEAVGRVVDVDDQPVVGATITFRPEGNPTLEYTATTNKKGKYFVGGLFTPKEDDMWNVEFSVDGYEPVHILVESRSVNRVLIGDIMKAKLNPGQKIPQIMIRPLGTVKVEFVVATASEVEAEAMGMALAASAAAAGEAGEAAGDDGNAGRDAPQLDPWVEGLNLAASGDIDAARPLLEQAAEQAPDDAERQETLAKVLFQLDDPAAASAAAERAIAVDSTRIDAHMIVFSAREMAGDLDGAREALEAAREAVPDDPRVLQRLAYLAGRSGDPAGAIAAYQTLTELDPGDVEAWLALGSLYAETGDLEKSRQAYQKVVEIDPTQAHQTYYNLGVLLINRGSGDDTRRAIDAFRKAIELKDDYAAAYQQLGFALLGNGERSAAAAALESYVKLAPDAADAGRMKGLVSTLRK